MAANSSDDLSVTEPDLKKPKLDDGDNDEAETVSFESVKRGTTTKTDGGDTEKSETMDIDTDSDFEDMVVCVVYLIMS